MAKTKIGSNAPFGGASKNLVYIGEHVYAYSGKYSSSTSSQTLINMVTGKGYIIANFQCNGATADINSSTVGNGNVTVFTIKFNGVIIARLKSETANEDMPPTIENKLIIPPYTNITVDTISASSDSNLTPTVNIVGRIYES